MTAKSPEDATTEKFADAAALILGVDPDQILEVRVRRVEVKVRRPGNDQNSYTQVTNHLIQVD